MGDKAITGTITILTAIIGVAIVAVLVSKQSNTASVLGAGGNAFTSVLKAALSPISGGTSMSTIGSPSLLSNIGSGIFGNGYGG